MAYEPIHRSARQPVPGPSTNPTGIAAQAIAVREGAPVLEAMVRENREATAGNGREVEVRQQSPVGQPPPRQGPIGNLTKAIAAAMAEVGTIPKRGHNKFHNYDYVLVEDLLLAVTPLMGKHGITIFQDEIKISPIENRIAVLYEYTIAHTSGETKIIHDTKMAIARDSKGNYDDKAIAKCHTASRKYVILSLFQVPSGDFPDTDGDEQPQKRVPGPGSTQKSKPEQEAHRAPQKIGLGAGAGPSVWADKFVDVVGHAKSEREIRQWDALNDKTLQNLSELYPAVYERIETAMNKRLQQLADAEGTAPFTLPEDNQEAMNLIASTLAQTKTFEAAQAFWNTTVAPVEQRFDAIDWEMLMGEWKRAEARLAPPDDEPEPKDAA